MCGHAAAGALKSHCFAASVGARSVLGPHTRGKRPASCHGKGEFPRDADLAAGDSRIRNVDPSDKIRQSFS
jgi:hypothetical protein